MGVVGKDVLMEPQRVHPDPGRDRERAVEVEPGRLGKVHAVLDAGERARAPVG